MVANNVPMRQVWWCDIPQASQSAYLRRLPASAISRHLCDNGEKNSGGRRPTRRWPEAGGAAGRPGGFGANVKPSQEQRVAVAVAAVVVGVALEHHQLIHRVVLKKG